MKYSQDTLDKCQKKYERTELIHSMFIGPTVLNQKLKLNYNVSKEFPKCPKIKQHTCK